MLSKPDAKSRNVAHLFPQPDISSWWPGRALAIFAKVTFMANTRGLASLGGERYTAIALDACQLTYSEVPWLEN
jgi:hypothetical protein